MAVTAKMVKELREITGAGMMDCKRALEETNGDIQQAIDHLREKGMSSAANKAGRIAAEGSTFLKEEGNKAVLIEVNCETDFVTKNDTFKKLLDDLASHILAQDSKEVEEVLAQKLNGTDETVEQYINSVIATVGEKISLRRFSLIQKTDADAFGTYVHMDGRIGVLALVEGTTDGDAAKDIAMHIAAVNPKYISRDEVDADEVERESVVLRNQALNEGKPEKIVERMVEGRLGKFFEEVCLLEQDFVKDSDQKVKKFVESLGATVKSFVRYEVGEGMEKRDENFADEVMSQIKK